MDIRAQLEDRLTVYVEDTLGYTETVRDFCDQEQEWTSKRKAEIKKMIDIVEIQEEEDLTTILEDILKGLKKLEPFLDAVEKLTVTSIHVFSEQIFQLCGQSPEIVQSVITDARIDAPVLIHFKRNAETFFRPLIHNVHVLVFQLDNYILKTEQLCRRVRQNSVLCGDIYKCQSGQPLVQLTLNTSENAMNQMLHHLSQLCEIRMNQHTRLAFLFHENAQKFIDVFGERRSRMWQFLADLEQTAVKLDSMKMGASISAVASSSVGIVGGVLSILGIALAPFTAGTSLVCTAAGVGLGAVTALNTIVTDITETKVNQHHKHNAQSYLKSYKDDMIKIEDCLNEVANREGPLVQPSAVDAKTILTCIGAVHKSEKATVTEIALEDLNTARDVTQVTTNLSRTGQLAKVEQLTATNVVKGISGIANLIFIGLDSYFIVKQSINLANGSESEVSKLIRSRASLWKSELEAWEKMHDSLCIGIKTIRESLDALEKPFLP